MALIIAEHEDLKNQISIELERKENHDSKLVKRGVINNVHVNNSMGFEELKDNKFSTRIREKEGYSNSRGRTATATTNDLFSKRIT